MIRPVLYPDLVALARVYMAQPQDRDLIQNLCELAHCKGWSLEDATHDQVKVDGFSLNSNWGLGAFLFVLAEVLAWRRARDLP
ncbi:MAG: hypothetical protein AAF826_05110 [Pseudomonadota bacterium]